MSVNMEHYLTGVCRWAKVFEPDTKYGPVYSIEVKLDDEDYERYRTAGCQGELSKDGLGYLRFRRPEKMMTRKGSVLTFGKPLVIDDNGEPFEKSIGNGSRVQIKIATFDTEKGVGTRLEAIRVLEHVEFTESDTQKNREFKPVW